MCVLGSMLRVGFRFPSGALMEFFSPPHSDRFWGPPGFLSNEYRMSEREADHSPPFSAKV